MAKLKQSSLTPRQTDTITEPLPPAILIDLHKTIMDENYLINSKMTNIINALFINFKIIIFTASAFDKAQQKIVEKGLKQNNVKFNKFYALENVSNKNDVDIKMQLFNEIKTQYYVTAVIDNNKDVCKAFNKIGIYTLRAKEGK